MPIVRALIGVQLGLFFLLPPMALSALIGHLGGMLAIIPWGGVCSFLYGYVQARGLMKFEESVFGRVYVSNVSDIAHLTLLRFNALVIAILLLSMAFRGSGWME